VPKRGKGFGARGLIDTELAEVESERRQLEERRNRLLAARAALDGEGVAATPRPRRVSREEVTEYLRQNPGSTTSEVSTGMGVKPTNIAQHLSRGGKEGIYRYEHGRWSVAGE
jgi:hypothetical protein